MTSAIIVAAGKGSRMNAHKSKQYLEVGGRAILYWTLRVFLDSPLVDEIVLIISRSEETLYKTCVGKYIDTDKPVKLVYGGEERSDSVINGLRQVDPNAEYLLIHDGVRPFVRTEEIEKVLDGLQDYPACITGVYVKDTIKILKEDQTVASTPERRLIFAAHTPQGFRKQQLQEAYQRFQDNFQKITITDEASLMEETGYEVKAVVGSYENIKITTPEDLLLAERILEKRLREQ